MSNVLLSLAYGLPSAAAASMAGVIFLATLALIMLRPRRLNEAFAALGGAAAMLLAGIISPLQAIQTLLTNWNIFLFFLGMLSLSATEVSSLEYFKLGIIVTPLMLLVGALAIWLLVRV